MPRAELFGGQGPQGNTWLPRRGWLRFPIVWFLVPGGLILACHLLVVALTWAVPSRGWIVAGWVWGAFGLFLLVWAFVAPRILSSKMATKWPTRALGGFAGNAAGMFATTAYFVVTNGSFGETWAAAWWISASLVAAIIGAFSAARNNISGQSDALKIYARP